jgi:hypothetical protein
VLGQRRSPEDRTRRRVLGGVSGHIGSDVYAELIVDRDQAGVECDIVIGTACQTVADV